MHMYKKSGNVCWIKDIGKSQHSHWGKHLLEDTSNRGIVSIKKKIKRETPQGKVPSL